MQPGDRIISAIPRFIRSPASAYLTDILYRVGDKRLTPTQVDALETLASRANWHVHEFASVLRVNPSTASRSADRLINLGLAERHIDSTDRRYVIVRATPAGLRACLRIQRDRYALMREVMADVSDEERALLADLLDRVAGGMERAANRRSTEDLSSRVISAVGSVGGHAVDPGRGARYPL